MKTKMKTLVFTIILVFFTSIISMADKNSNVVLIEEESELSVEPWMLNDSVWCSDMNHKHGMKHEMRPKQDFKQDGHKGMTYHGMKQGMKHGKHKGNMEYAMGGRHMNHYVKMTPEMLREKAAKLNKMSEMMIKKADMMEKNK